MKILAIYDDDSTLDRYTVVTDVKQGRWHDMLGLSQDPTAFNGFSQWVQGMYFPVGDNDHLGQRIQFEDLDGKLQQHIAQRIFLQEKDNATDKS